MVNSATTNNTILLFLLCVSMILSTVLGSGVDLFSYIACFFSACLVFKGVLSGRVRFSAYIVAMMIILCLHFVFTSDKVTTMILCLITLFLYEAVANQRYSVRAVLYIFLISFAIGFVLTFPSFLSSLFVVHTDRSDYYQSFFHNSNTYSAFCLMTLMCTIMFMKPSKVKLILTILLVLNIYASGSRNGLLFLITSVCFYFFHKSKFAKYSYVLFILFLLMATYYLFFIEMSSSIDFTVMGKSANSAGRALQIIYVIDEFPLKLLGCGKDIIDASINRIGDYSIHNFYINSLYSFGVMPLLGYLYYIYRIWKTLPSIVAKSFLMAFNIYFFFEPGTCYYLLFLNVMPMIIILLSKQLPERENNNFKLI